MAAERALISSKENLKNNNNRLVLLPTTALELTCHQERKSSARQKRVGAHVLEKVTGVFFSLSFTYDQLAAWWARLSSPKGKDSELSDGTVGQKSGVFRLRVFIS